MSVPDAKYYASRKWKTADWKKRLAVSLFKNEVTPRWSRSEITDHTCSNRPSWHGQWCTRLLHAWGGIESQGGY